MADLDEKHQQIQKDLWPQIYALTEKVNSYPGLCITGFIYEPDGEFFLRIGNIDNTGLDLVRIHWTLSQTAAYLESRGQGAVVEMEIPKGEKQEKTVTEIADRMAELIMSMPPDILPEEVNHAVDDYLHARMPTIKQPEKS